MIARVTLVSPYVSGRLDRYGTFFLPIRIVSRSPAPAPATVKGTSAVAPPRIAVNTGTINFLTDGVRDSWFCRAKSTLGLFPRRPAASDQPTQVKHGTMGQKVARQPGRNNDPDGG